MTCLNSVTAAKMSAMTFRVYVRWPNQTVTDKTTTESRKVAELAYQELVERPDLVGKPCGVAFNEDGRQIRYYAFDEASADNER